jgi:hypothetical protein
MKKSITLFLGLTASFILRNKPETFSVLNQNLILPASGGGFISNNLGEQNSPDFVNYLNSFNVGLKAYKITYYTKNEKNNLVKATDF